MRPWRFNELRKDLEGISQKVLTDSLRAMEEDGIITRTVYAEVPPRVEYALSPLGEPMKPILDAMEQWGTEYKKSDAVIRAILFFRFQPPYHFSGHASHYRTRRHILCHHRSGCNDGIFSDGYTGKDRSMGSDPDIFLPHGWMPECCHFDVPVPCRD